ncbi:MAG: hypothetical protein ACRD1V_15790 [Vicinamibacterales bacterium]
MTTSAPPFIECEQIHAGLAVSNISAAIAFYTKQLHTNEGVGPHTQTTVHYIQELKKKHGIDYDCHASYRFVED